MSAKIISRIFILLMTINILYFLYWGIGYTQSNNTFYFIAAALFGLFMAFNIGGNDVANSFGTSVGAKTLTVTQALCIAAIFEISGAMIAGGEVTSTIKNGIVDIEQFGIPIEPLQFMQIMLCALIAAAFWLLFATKMGLPVSTTHSIIGGIVGAALMLASMHSHISANAIIRWSKIGEIVLSWIISPLLGGLTAYCLYGFIKRYILQFNERATAHLRLLRNEKIRLSKITFGSAILLSQIQQSAYEDSLALDDKQRASLRRLNKLHHRENQFNAHAALQIWVPMLAAITAMTMSAMLIYKGLNNLHLPLTIWQNNSIILITGVSAWISISYSAKRLQDKKLNRSTFLLFSWMQVFTACIFAFSHGSNDIANAVGPFAAIVDTLRTHTVNQHTSIPSHIMLAFGIALIVGLWFIGKNVIATVGSNLTKMHPASGFSAELSAATVVMFASALGLPVSSTHILVGAVLGVGLVNRNANWRLMRPIALAWVVTVPIAACIAAIAFLLLNSL